MRKLSIGDLVVYYGITYKIVRERMVDFAPGYVLESSEGALLLVEKTWVERLEALDRR